jgi:hypothetical protein
MAERLANKNARGYYEIRGTKTLEIDLGENDLPDYAVVQKDIPGNIDTAYGELTVRWVNAFGVRYRNKDTKKLEDFANIQYTVIMDALPAGQRLFAYYGNQIHEVLNFKTEGGKTRFSLGIGDPPIGLAP